MVRNAKELTKAATNNSGELRFKFLHGVVASPVIDRLVEEIIGRIASKRAMLLLEALAHNGVVRFSQLAKMLTGISQSQSAPRVHSTVPRFLPSGSTGIARFW